MSEQQQNDSNETTNNNTRLNKISFKVKPLTNRNGKKILNVSNPVRPSLFEEKEDDGKSNAVRVKGIDISKGTAIVDPDSELPEPKETKKELVIPALPNRDWRNNIIRRQGGSKYQPLQQSEVQPEAGIPKKEELTFGLNKGVKSIKIDDKDSKSEELQEENSKPKTEDEKAVLALINNGISSNTTSDITIAPVNSQYNRSVTYVDSDEEKDEEFVEPISEAEAFLRDISSRPDAPSLNAYNEMPVEEFGAALLRGMGWKGPESESRKNDKTHKIDIDGALRRPAFLGIGAKPMDLSNGKNSSQPSTEIGAWGKSAATRDERRNDRIYVPLIKVDKETGTPVLDEEEDNKPKSPRSEKERQKDSKSKYEERRYSSRKRSDSKERRTGPNYNNYDDRDYERKRLSRNYEGSSSSSRRSDHKKTRSTSPKSDHRRYGDEDEYYRERNRRDDDRSRSNRSNYKNRSKDYDQDSRRYDKRRDHHDYNDHDDRYRSSSRRNEKKHTSSIYR